MGRGYPDVPPDVRLLNPRGISDQSHRQLTEEVRQLVRKMLDSLLCLMCYSIAPISSWSTSTRHRSRVRFVSVRCPQLAFLQRRVTTTLTLNVSTYMWNTLGSNSGRSSPREGSRCATMWTGLCGVLSVGSSWRRKWNQSCNLRHPLVVGDVQA